MTPSDQKETPLKATPEEAWEWLSRKHRGTTVYEGHPLQVIEAALRSSQGVPQEVVDALEIFIPWAKSAYAGNQHNYGISEFHEFKALEKALSILKGNGENDPEQDAIDNGQFGVGA